MLNEILLFSREYLNDKKQRTTDRKQKIRIVYKELTGENINGRCSTCYIEALLKIIRLNEPLITKQMAAKNYELKKGVLLQAFGHPEKTCTNDTLTDELAQWHLAQHPGKAIFFSRMPEAPKPIIKVITPIVQPKPDNPVEILNSAVKEVNKEPEKVFEKAEAFKKSNDKRRTTKVKK